ncbi:hypothetical protein BH09PLA1_BH09PLA1_03220 [soil metagenome]
MRRFEEAIVSQRAVRILARAASILVASAIASTARATSKTYIGGGGTGNWATSGNWSPAGAPGFNDVVTISPADASARNIVYDGTIVPFRMNTVTIQSTGTGSVTLRNAGGIFAADNLNINTRGQFLQTFLTQFPQSFFTAVTVSGGTLGGSIVTNGTMTISTLTQNSGTVFGRGIFVDNHYSMLGGSLGSGIDSTNITNNGVMDYNAGTASNGSFINKGTFNYNNGTSLFDMSLVNFGVMNFNANPRVFQFINVVSLTLPAGRTLTASKVGADGGTFTQLGTVDAQLGEIEARNGISANTTGIWDQRPGTTTLSRFCTVDSDGVYLLSAGASLVATGSLTVFSAGRFVQSGGSVTIGGGSLGSGTLAISNGTYSISGGILSVGTAIIGGINGAFAQSGGVVQIGTLGVGQSANNSVQLLISGGRLEVTAIDVPARNDGVITQTGGSSRFFKIDGTGNINLGGNGSLTSTSLRQNSVQLSGSGKIFISTTPAPSTSRILALSFDEAGGSVHGTLDIGEVPLIVDYALASPIGDIRRYLRSGYASGNWNGTGLRSAAAAIAEPRNTALGYVEASQLLGASGGAFEGVSVDNTAVLVRYTYFGDTDFNGVVNFDDYARTDNGFNNSGNDWFHGDFDYNGVVNFDDYALIDLAFNTQSGLLRTSVPEPATAAIAFAVAILFCARQRRGLSDASARPSP